MSHDPFVYSTRTLPVCATRILAIRSLSDLYPTTVYEKLSAAMNETRDDFFPDKTKWSRKEIQKRDPTEIRPKCSFLKKNYFVRIHNNDEFIRQLGLLITNLHCTYILTRNIVMDFERIAFWRQKK